MGIIIGNSSKYAAFISYAHADEASAKRLHNALETYPLPKGMDAGQRAKLSPIFRDVTELTAHHSLSEKIREAVKTSRFLIVLCSPAAKASHWVNEEIRLFRSLHGEGAILAVIVDGVPDTAFPPALLEDGREPLAADISGKEGFKFGVTQLAASMLGVGLDTLVQRDQRRRRIRTQIISGATTALALIMGALAWNAVDARDEAEVSRNEAEKMVEFMIKDLKEDLDPIGKLDILNGVGERVTDYYDAIPLSDMDDDRLGRRARALHILGDVALDQGKYERAETELKGAYDATKEILNRHPNDSAAIYNHAQSEYWIGKVFYDRGDFFAAKPYWENYKNLASSFSNLTEFSLQEFLENGYAENNLGSIERRLDNHQRANKHFRKAVSYYDQALSAYPNNREVLLAKANSYAGIAQSSTQFTNIEEILAARIDQINIYEKLLLLYPDDKGIIFRLIKAQNYILALKGFEFPRKHQRTRDQLIQSMSELVSSDYTNERWLQYLLKISQAQVINEFLIAKPASSVAASNVFNKTKEHYLKTRAEPTKYIKLMFALQKLLEAYSVVDFKNNNPEIKATVDYIRSFDPIQPDHFDIQFDAACILYALGYTEHAGEIFSNFTQSKGMNFNLLTLFELKQMLIGTHYTDQFDQAEVLLKIMRDRGFEPSLPHIQNHCKIMEI